jgi:hypothetical protein
MTSSDDRVVQHHKLGAGLHLRSCSFLLRLLKSDDSNTAR